ncbi:hypothetical protein EW026_g7692 [Hermanssonia centrifuga]|uniref:NACHT domain-containing protein n=1 Tax=Hermanssonia centrifuga TaxID=98765 RepID=A0A4S4K800_9APHY|nr:hypothetical protein EW026_g7692 [Hermanssonia centrifuga]
MVRAKEVGGELLEGADIVEEALSPIVKKTDFSAFIKNVEVFVGIVDTIAEVHPYAKMAWLLVKGVYTIVQDQIHRDDKVKDLFLQMASLYEIVENLRLQLEDGGIKSSTELLSRISKQTVNCCYFIRDYASPGLMKRMAKSTFATVDKRILEYTDAFKSLKDEFHGNLHVETRVIVSLVLKGVERLETTVDLNDMSYYPSSLGPSKRCLFGTREEPLERMTTWANSDSQDHPSILVLTGPAGTGKSALAHTMAHQFRELERLGSSFGFDRNESTRSIKLLFPTIARDLADLNDDIRNALWAAVGKSKEIRMTQDLSLQFENLIAKPLKSIVLSGPVLVVIDALDECGDAGTREQLLSILKTCADNFPPNLRLLITTRPEDDILTHLQDAPHILIWRLDNISSSIETSEDIRLYTHYHLISSRKPKLDGIDDECCRRLVTMSQGLFQWASVACSQIIGTGKPGLTARERYELLVKGSSGPRVDQERLLDKLYLQVLRQLFTEESTGALELARFRSALVAVLTSFEPMTLESLNNLRKASNDAGEPYVDAKVVLQYLGSLLSGVTASESYIPIRPLHTSFRDFLTTKQRSFEFSVDVAELQAHERLCLASLRIMKRDLAFNICKLESSYVMNEDILDLPKRIRDYIPERLSYSCRFWARHLDVALPNGMALEIPRQIRELLEPFINEKLLFWLEVLSVLGGVALALSAFAIVARVLKSVSAVFLES